MVDAIFKAGFYYIGDPVNVIREWDAFLGHIDPGRNESIFEFRKKAIAVGYTKNGDEQGLFDGIRIESGMLALVAAEAISKIDFDREAGLFIGFEDDFRVIIDDGYFVFGDIEIDTTNEEDRFEELLLRDREIIWDDDDNGGWDYDGGANGW